MPLMSGTTKDEKWSTSGTCSRPGWCPRPRLLRSAGNGQPAQVRLALPPTRTRLDRSKSAGGDRSGKASRTVPSKGRRPQSAGGAAAPRTSRAAVGAEHRPRRGHHPRGDIIEKVYFQGRI